MARLFKTPVTVEGAVTSNGLVLSSTTSPITLNGQVGTTGQVLTSAGAGATPTWNTVSNGSASNSFATISTPSGTSPVADSSTDTLTFTAGTGITITGDSAADSIAIATNGATANGASTLILRDASGGFAAGAITGISFNSITGLSSTTPGALGTAAVGTATTAARADHVHPTANTVVATVTGTNSADLVYGNMADNDQFRIRVGGTATNAGFVEIATADDGTEPIHVRQYTGVFTTLARTATLLDGSGNTSFPGTVTGITFSGSGASLTNVPGANVTGTLTSTVLGNSAVFIGTTSVALNRTTGSLALTGISSVTLPGSTSGTAQIIPAAVAGTGTVITLPATTGTVITTGDSSTVTNTMLAGSIANAKLSNSAVTIGSTSVSLGSTVSTFAGVTLTLPTIGGTGAAFSGSTSGTTTVVASAAAGTTTITLPATTGTVVTTGDSATVTNTMLAGSIANAKLSNTAVSLGGQTLTLGAAATTTISGMTSVSSSTLTSTVATGTAPFTVTSTTLVTNLNADLLDGLSSNSANSASTIVARDVAGSFAGNVITATTVTATTFNGSGSGLTNIPVANVTGTVANAAAASSAGSLGYVGMPQNSQSGAYTLVAGDAGKHIYYTVTGQTATIPANGTVAYQIGTTITFITAPSVSLSIAITTDTMRLANTATTGTRTLAANGIATAIKVTSTAWIISGNGLS